jgi:hypothetical protein
LFPSYAQPIVPLLIDTFDALFAAGVAPFPLAEAPPALLAAERDYAAATTAMILDFRRGAELSAIITTSMLYDDSDDEREVLETNEQAEAAADRYRLNLRR